MNWATNWSGVLERIASEAKCAITVTYDPNGEATTRWVICVGTLVSGTGATLEEALANLQAVLRRLGYSIASQGSLGDPPVWAQVAAAHVPSSRSKQAA